MHGPALLLQAVLITTLDALSIILEAECHFIVIFRNMQYTFLYKVSINISISAIRMKNLISFLHQRYW